MELFLFITNILLVGVIVYSDWQNRKERADLQLKLMSKDVSEYEAAKLPTPKPEKEIPDPYIDPYEVDPNDILQGKDIT